MNQRYPSFYVTVLDGEAVPLDRYRVGAETAIGAALTLQTFLQETGGWRYGYRTVHGVQTPVSVADLSWDNIVQLDHYPYTPDYKPDDYQLDRGTEGRRERPEVRPSRAA